MSQKAKIKLIQKKLNTQKLMKLIQYKVKFHTPDCENVIPDYTIKDFCFISVPDIEDYDTFIKNKIKQYIKNNLIHTNEELVCIKYKIIPIIE